MTLAIMQPYLFPYIGYWQLLNIVDKFVIYDDVNYIKQGYINRNSILANNNAQIFTLELIGASSNKLINEIEIGNNRKKILKTIHQNYIKAPFYKDVISVINEIINNEEKNLAKFIGYSIFKIAEYLEIDTKILYSSEITKNSALKAQDKVIDICKNLNANKYINAIGGQELYSKDVFQQNGIELNFIKTNISKYNQFDNEFVAYLSIIDIMMFNAKSDIAEHLDSFELV